jgi:hypothetical protein
MNIYCWRKLYDIIQGQATTVRQALFGIRIYIGSIPVLVFNLFLFFLDLNPNTAKVNSAKVPVKKYRYLRTGIVSEQHKLFVYPFTTAKLHL